MSQAKERPILFSGHMVRAILNGQKTVTRREIKPSMRSADSSFELHQQEDESWRPMHTFDESCMDAKGTEHPIVCPYGQPGDRLWVRESWAQINVAQAPGESWVVYRECDNRTDYGGPWKPSIHMRRRDSRILLEVTAVRVERLQGISKQQALAEGVRLYTDHAECGDWYHVEGIETYSADPCKSFELLWESTGGDWATNPWVWVVEFKVIEPSPAGCDYHGSHFGAPYPDAQCVDGFLWDEDSCDVPGGPLMSGGDIPCPKCNAEAYADHQREMSQ